ncbi:MAG: hypothetical protein Hens3KO_15530 [Henriciella sp.]
MFKTALKWIARIILGAGLVLGLANCTMLGLNYSSLDTDNKPVPSPALTADFNADETRRTFEDELYGPWPTDLPVSASDWRMVDSDYLGGRGTLEEISITIGEGQTARTFYVVVALPNQNNGPAPVILSQTFSDNCSVFPEDQVTAQNGTICEGTRLTGTFGFLATQIFGSYIAYAPIDRYFDAGLGYASFEGSGFVPDRKETANVVMSDLSPGPVPTGTLMAWAFGYDSVAKILASNPRIRPDAIAATGHSRYGKSALVAAAWSEAISAAIAHQSGFAGAASSNSTTGETLKRMAQTYPHWLRPGLHEDLEAGKHLSLDQHFLLALAAPKPVLLGNGRRDVWSDPNSTFRIARAADAVYESYGVEGLPDGGMRTFDPSSEIAYWLRVGGHSVVSEDIDAFIAFMSAHFPTGAMAELALQ